MATWFAWAVLALAPSALRAEAPTPDLEALPGEKVQLKVCYLRTEPGETPAVAPGAAGALGPEEGFMPPVVGGKLPAEFLAWAGQLTVTDTPLLHVFSGDAGLTQEQFPLRELAALVNSLPCRFVVTIIDLPTRAQRPGPAPVLDDILAARERYELFHRGMTIFVSGPFERRLLRGHRSAFFDYFAAGVVSGFADTNHDHAVSLWEAYEYAFWCTDAHAVDEVGRPQTPLYSLGEAWTAQPLLVSDLGDRPSGPDPQRAVFGAANRRHPAWNGGCVCLDGPMGPPGPSWMSWIAGPAPTEASPDTVAAWAAHDLSVLEEHVRQLETTVAPLAALHDAPPPMPPAPKVAAATLSFGRRSTPPGPAGPPAGPSDAASAARKEALEGIADADRRAVAAENDRLLEQVGWAALKLEVRVADTTASVLDHYEYGTPSPSPRYHTPQRWPAGLDAPPRDEGDGGPAGALGRVPPGAELKLDAPAKDPLWSPSLTDRLRSLLQRLQACEAKLR